MEQKNTCNQCEILKKKEIKLKNKIKDLKNESALWLQQYRLSHEDVIGLISKLKEMYDIVESQNKENERLKERIKDKEEIIETLREINILLKERNVITTPKNTCQECNTSDNMYLFIVKPQLVTL